MGGHKLLVFCLDALCAADVEVMKDLPSFRWVLERGSRVHHMEMVYPSLTYPSHASILTGVTVGRHQIYHNAILDIEDPDPPWYNQRSDIHARTLLDVAEEAGLVCGAISWPVMGKANIHYNLPMIVPVSYSGDDPYQFLEGNATQELLDRYYWKHGRYLKGADRNLDAFTMGVALDMLEDYPQPDIFLIKMCDLDTVKHVHGIKNEFVNEQLRKHDRELGSILEGLRRKGTLDDTNIVVLGDHGQMDITKSINMNVLLKQNGFIRTDEEGRLVDYDAYCHSASLSAWIQLKDPNDEALRQRVYEFLLSCRDDPAYNIGYVFTKEEAREMFGLYGPMIDFVLEGREAMSFETTLEGEDLFRKYLPEGMHTSAASHGHLPWRDETTTFFGCGPDLAQGVLLERASLLDEAPTMAAMMGLSMEDVDGHVLTELLRI